ncbi:UDP-N-acetylglucosamine--N-acetylmuramyl-(pentapeptide) pyrophosphoryl-undecaprenol N-acetylglucosamine transferase [bioreactor metagenome]|uniref:UDP-N-acetylglucosamine--N-acetylmuramyl-(Pentapeptide) pyrophosphoryl-undecaprenol N-acetylglucosamine transferase n=1 Tax=bioreactor metagenome TaxID=1076179 RepID=A0A644ZK54_9ZZZZ|nr:undecaprenyldiphospho-muramoylpentapeptide beta-N-acetylglucosaminyltransferase [Oscillospiraceae bacterium]
MRVLLSGGGTGGHINPALSIAKRILVEEPDSTIAFVGTPKGMENRLVSKENFPIYHVDVMGYQRKLTPKNIKAAFLAITSVYKAEKIIREFRPDAVVGTGGYVCWPVLRAAAKMRIPTFVHEQNAVVGMTVKMLSKYVDRILVAFEESKNEFNSQDKIRVVGNPVDPRMLGSNQLASRDSLGITGPFVLSYGGSLGARPVNEAVFDMMKDYSSKRGIYHTHAFGTAAYQSWYKKAEENGLSGLANIKLLEYIYNMPELMAAADIVISRAGALTLSELAVLNKPAILIPSPYVTGNHQYKNAKMFADAGAAILIEEKELSGERLSSEVDALLRNPKIIEKMKSAMRAFAVTDSDKRIYRIIKEITG